MDKSTEQKCDWVKYLELDKKLAILLSIMYLGIFMISISYLITNTEFLGVVMKAALTADRENRMSAFGQDYFDWNTFIFIILYFSSVIGISTALAASLYKQIRPKKVRK